MGLDQHIIIFQCMKQKDSGLDEKDVSNISTGMIMGSGGPSIENVILAADKTREKSL